MEPIVIDRDEFEKTQRDPKVQALLRRADESNRRMHSNKIFEVLNQHLGMCGEDAGISESKLREIARDVYEQDRKGPWYTADMSDWEEIRFTDEGKEVTINALKTEINRLKRAVSHAEYQLNLIEGKPNVRKSE